MKAKRLEKILDKDVINKVDIYLEKYSILKRTDKEYPRIREAILNAEYNRLKERYMGSYEIADKILK